MGSTAGLFRQYWAIAAFFIGLAVIYLIQAVTNVPDASVLEKYDITATQARQLSLAIAVPYVLIWIVGLIGYLGLRSYTSYLGTGKDAKGFKTLTRGVLLFTFWLPASTLLSNLASNYYDAHPGATAGLTIMVNYVNLLILGPAFYLVYKGANQLVAITKAKYSGMSPKQIMLFLAFSACYVFIAFNDAARNAATDTDSTATYYLPDWLILTTIVIPRIIIWFIGFSAVASMILYRREVKGAIYKHALRHLSFGLAGVLVATITLRIVQSLSAKLNELSLTILFVVVYLLLIIIASGYVLIASGARRLQRIEES